jgi:hypothetical protein
MTKPDHSHKAAASSEMARRTGAHQPPATGERRKNPHLRELIDEMLASVRVAVNRDLWTPEERAHAETELNELMGRIRSQAIAKAD